MADEDDLFTISARRGLDVKDALVIVGTPGLGLVGTIGAQYIVNHLSMPLSGGIHALDFPPVCTIDGGRPLPPFRIHVAEARRNLGFDCERVVVITSEIEVQDEWANRLADAIVKWAKKGKCRVVAGLDGIIVEDDAAQDIVVGVASVEDGVTLLEEQGVPALSGGIVGGMMGALLQAGQRHDVNVVTLLAETAPGFPDARAATRLVEILDRLVPGIKIEAEPLRKEADAIEHAVREMKERIENERNKRDTTSMYG